VTAVFSPVTTTSSSLLTLTVGGTAAAGASSPKITATSGGLTHTLTLNLTVAPPIPGATPVSLSPDFNRAGIYTDGRVFSGGLDQGGSAYSANLLGPRPSLGNVLFNLGPANANDTISCSGQTIPLPAGQYTTLQMLATGVDGNQNDQTFTVTYTDNSTATFTQNFSDWYSPQHNAGESIIATLPYRDSSNGTKDNRTFYLYEYSWTLNQTKMAKSIQLPNNGNVVVLALTLVNAPAPVSLASLYNRAGIYSDGTTFTNPPTGGIDGSGYAYSANLLTGSLIWTNTLFNFGPANVNNVISATGQTIPLPAGNYAVLRMLATGVQGNQPSQSFSVHYADGSGSSFFQNLSDWYSPQNYSGESKALIMGHRNNSDGTKDNRTFNLYGYSFNLNSAKVVQSVSLPNNSHVVVLAISLIPNWPPTFNANPFTEPEITAGQNYAANISTNASDLNGDMLAFAKVSGPTWLKVSQFGVLSGMPLSTNVGPNSFEVSATDPGGLSNTATLNINVQPAPPIVSTIAGTVTNIRLSWSGGIAPYQVQMSTNLTIWDNIGDPASSNSFVIVPTNPASFYRIVGQ
jgi:Putative Ig domain